MAKLDWLHNEFLSMYLEYVDNTEPPVLMHLWSAITCASAVMGRHIWLPFGIGNIYPNMYTLLVGPPGTRKSTAIGFASGLAKSASLVRFAPDDTGGQRQGLIAAMEGEPEEDADEKQTAVIEAADALSPQEQLNELAASKLHLASLDSNTMFICTSEWGSFVGEGNTQLLRFLIRMWDNEPYEYKLKLEQKTLRNANLTMLCGTTSTEIATLLPAEAQGQGFMSRIVLVHAARKRHKVPEPSLREDLVQPLMGGIARLSYEMKGPMQVDQQAREKFNAIYMQDVRIDDTRFVYYTERRHTHLQKLAMVLAGLRGDMVIRVADVQEADRILAETERHMPDALGEFGMSPLAIARQRMSEFVQNAGQPVTEKVLWQVMQKDMRLTDFHTMLNELVTIGKFFKLTSGLGPAYIWQDIDERTGEVVQMPDRSDRSHVTVAKRDVVNMLADDD